MKYTSLRNELKLFASSLAKLGRRLLLLEASIKTTMQTLGQQQRVV